MEDFSCRLVGVGELLPEIPFYFIFIYFPHQLNIYVGTSACHHDFLTINKREIILPIIFQSISTALIFNVCYGRLFPQRSPNTLTFCNVLTKHAG